MKHHNSTTAVWRMHVRMRSFIMEQGSADTMKKVIERSLRDAVLQKVVESIGTRIVASQEFGIYTILHY